MCLCIEIEKEQVKRSATNVPSRISVVAVASSERWLPIDAPPAWQAKHNQKAGACQQPAAAEQRESARAVTEPHLTPKEATIRHHHLLHLQRLSSLPTTAHPTLHTPTPRRPFSYLGREVWIRNTRSTGSPLRCRWHRRRG